LTEYVAPDGAGDYLEWFSTDMSRLTALTFIGWTMFYKDVALRRYG
jgi:hypothetical protein